MTRANLRIAETIAADPRVDEILAHARMAFVEKGFDGASMQDLARAAGMSAGNFYRYFPSKAAIVEALVARDLDEVERDFELMIGSSDVVEEMRRKLRCRIESDHQNDHPLWAEIMAAAARKPEIAIVVEQMERSIKRLLVRVFARISKIDEETAYLRYGSHAQLVILLVRGSSMEKLRSTSPQTDLTNLIVRTIDMLVDEIVSNAAGD